MMRIMKRFLTGILLTAVLLAAVSCGGADAPSPSPTATPTATAVPENLLSLKAEDGTCRYTIVRPDVCPQALISAAAGLTNRLSACLGTNVNITTDYVSRKATVPEDAFEILVGETNRSASSAALSELGENGWIIRTDGNKIVICGKTVAATEAAVEAFLGAVEDNTLPAVFSLAGTYEKEATETMKNAVKENLVPSAPYRATRLFLVNSVNGGKSVTLATLQGLAATLSSEQILVRAGSYTKYLPYIEAYGVSVEEADENGNAWTTESLLAYFAPQLKGYILCANDLESESASVAVSLAGILGGVVVTKEQEKIATDAGLSLLLDVSGKDDAWLRESAYFGELRTDVAVEQSVSMAPRLIDYAVMAKCYCYFYNGRNADEHTARFAFLEEGATVVGWNNTLGEYDTVKSLAGLSVQLIPADHACNVSTLSGFSLPSVEQKAEETDGSAVRKHTVCFVLSDGDNLQWFLNDYTADRWYGSALRGNFPMTWGIPASAIDLASPMLQYFYDNATDEDRFILQLSGMGYTFPSLWEEDARSDMAIKVAESMKRTGMKYMEILDDKGFAEDVLYEFATQKEIEGILYIDYSDYAGGKGEILWVGDTPAVSARYRLWGGLSDGSIANISQALNSASTDPTSADGYSFVIVHAWSGLGENGEVAEGGSSVAAVNALIEKLGESVDVVSVDEFMTRIRNNVRH